MPYKDRELEMRFSYGRLLLRRLPSPGREHYDLAGEVDLHSYRLAASARPTSCSTRPRAR